jgi:DNA/RNA-binding domain of Phe-tRNA-synthetase-like protein
MRFRVEPEIFAAFPGMRIAVAVATDLDNGAARPAVTAWWGEAWRAAGAAGAVYGNAQSHPRVQPWRERFRAHGVSPKDFPSSIEAMLRRALRGGEPFAINPLVDFYNAVSLHHVVPVGGFDLAGIVGPLELRRSREGDRFTALDAAEPVAVPPGEVAYADGSTILTRHFVWRQARTALIGAGTRSVVLVSEVLEGGSAGGAGGAGSTGRTEVVEEVLEDLVEGMRRFFRVRARGWVVDEATPEIAW